MTVILRQIDGPKPCPFCGKEAIVTCHMKVTVFPKSEDAYSIRCQNPECIMHNAEGYLYTTKEKAIAAWNTRAERTCKIVGWYHAGNQTEIGNRRVKLSCGHSARQLDSFCSTCGAKVV